MMSLKDAPYEMFYNISIRYDAEFYALDLSSKRGRLPPPQSINYNYLPCTKVFDILLSQSIKI
jgi:hypothetical protein